MSTNPRSIGASATPSAAKPKAKPKNKKNVIPIRNGHIAVYASPRISTALAEITTDMDLYHGVRLTQILEAVYAQGKKDGARQAFAELESKFDDVKKSIPHKNPGKPKKPR